MHSILRPLLSAVLILVASPLCADDWPQFRGPNCSGISETTASLPVDFSGTENVRWSAEIGDGVGSPVIAAGRLFVTAMVDEETVGVFAFDAQSGKPLWKQQLKTGPLPEVHLTNSHASTTPAADADHVYVYVPSLGMIAFDAASGAQVWQKQLPVPFFVFKWGPAMSPVLYEDMVIFCQDDDLEPAIYALNKETGQVMWFDDRSDMAVNYSHPVICQTDHGDELVVAGTGKLIGYDPRTGERLWHAKVLLRNIKTTPVCRDGVIYISLQSGGIANQWLATADQAETGNSDGKLTKEEMQGFVGEFPIPESFFKKTFDRGDLNKDGFLEGEELDIAFLHPDNFAGARFDAEEAGEQYVMAIRGGGRGDVTDSHVLWRHETKYTDHIVSPFVNDGRMFLIKGGGITTVFDTQEGKPLRRPKRINNTSEYFASPIYGDGKIYLAGENGFVVVIKDGPEYEVLAKNDMGDSIVGTPAIADGRLYVRTRTKLICVGGE